MQTRTLINKWAKYKSRKTIQNKLQEFYDIQKVHNYYKNVYFWTPSKTEEGREKKHKTGSTQIQLGKNFISYKYEYREDKDFCFFKDDIKINGDKTNFKTINTIINQLEQEEGIFQNIIDFFKLTDCKIKRAEEKKNEEIAKQLSDLFNYIDEKDYKEIYQNSTNEEIKFEAYKRIVEKAKIKTK